MEPESGEIIKSKRDNIRIHGGRQEDRNNDGNWVKKAKPELKKTEGCLRAYDDDMKTFKTKTDDLQKNNRQEKPGKVYVIDDLDEFIKQEQSK